MIDRWKNRGLNPADLDAAENESYANGKGQHFYRLYQDRLKALNACDFGDLMLHILNIFRGHREVLEQYQQRFKYILVDEYQDTNAVQYLWLRLLAQERKNICVVGDDDQSIYSWRGAEVANILRFEKDFPGAKVIRLEQNYRSTPDILGAASGLIATNSERLGKTLWTELQRRRQGPGDRRVGRARGSPPGGRRDRAAGARRRALEEVAILVRAQYQTREFEDRFIQIGLNYRIIGGFRFYERAEIRDALAYLRVIAQPQDDLAFERIHNQPKRGLGAKALETMHRHARAAGLPLAAAALQLADTDELPERAADTIGGLMRSFLRWRELAEQVAPAELLRTVLEETGYTAMLQAERSADPRDGSITSPELARAMEEYETLGEFLEHVSLVMDNDANDDDEKVTIMTIHAAKGLEFDMCSCPAGRKACSPRSGRSTKAAWPVSRRSGASPMSRSPARGGAARSSTPPTGASTAQWTSSIPSRFIAELPEAHIDQETTMTGGASLWRANWSERGGSLRRMSRATARTARHRAAAAGSARYRPATTPTPKRARRTRPQRRELCRQAAQRRHDRRAGVPRQVRLRRSGRARKATSSKSSSRLRGRKRVIDSFVQLAD